MAMEIVMIKEKKICKKMMIIISCFVFLLGSSGCKSTENTTTAKRNITTTIKKAKKKKLPKMNKDEMEAVYIIEDAQLFRMIKTRFQKYNKQAQTNEDKTAVFCQYADSLYRLCYTRCTLHMSTSSQTQSELYQRYLSLLYTYCDLYQSDMQSIVEKMKANDAQAVADPIWANIADIDSFYSRVLDKDVMHSKIAKKAQKYIQIKEQNKRLEEGSTSDQMIEDVYTNYYDSISSGDQSGQ